MVFSLTRRKLLSLTSSVTVLGVAGCSGDSQSNTTEVARSDGPGSTPSEASTSEPSGLETGDGVWLTSGGTNSQRAAKPSFSAAESLETKWQKDYLGFSSPTSVAAFDGRLYLTGRSKLDIYDIETGEKANTFELEEGAIDKIAIDESQPGLFLIVNNRYGPGRVIRVDFDGEFRWEMQLPDRGGEEGQRVGDAIARDGSLLVPVGTLRGDLDYLDTLAVYRYDVSDSTESGPSTDDYDLFVDPRNETRSQNGLVPVHDGYLLETHQWDELRYPDRNDEIPWVRDDGTLESVSVSVGGVRGVAADGSTIFVSGTERSGLYNLSSGSFEWQTDVSPRNIALGTDRVVVSSENIRSYDRSTGDQQWSFNRPNDFIGSVTLVDDAVYVHTAQKVFMLDADDGSERESTSVETGTDTLVGVAHEGQYTSIAPGLVSMISFGG